MLFAQKRIIGMIEINVCLFSSRLQVHLSTAKILCDSYDYFVTVFAQLHQNENISLGNGVLKKRKEI